MIGFVVSKETSAHQNTQIVIWVLLCHPDAVQEVSEQKTHKICRLASRLSGIWREAAWQAFADMKCTFRSCSPRSRNGTVGPRSRR